MVHLLQFYLDYIDTATGEVETHEKLFHGLEVPSGRSLVMIYLCRTATTSRSRR